MTDRTVEEAIDLIKSCVDPGHKPMSLKLSTLREMMNEIIMLRHILASKKSENSRIESKDDYEKRLRDQFAMAALQGLLSAWGKHDVTHPDEISSDAYLFADAMMEARKK